MLDLASIVDAVRPWALRIDAPLHAAVLSALTHHLGGERLRPLAAQMVGRTDISGVPDLALRVPETPLERAWLFAQAAERALLDPELDPDAQLRGAVYTPRGLAQATACAALLRAPGRDAVLDPCCGSGHLLLAMFEAGTPLHALHGIDIQPGSAQAAQAVLALAAGDDTDIELLTGLAKRIVVGDTLAAGAADGPRHIAELLGAPAAWDVVVANPPYQRAARRDAARLRAEFETPSGAFDLYVPFVELGLRLLKPDGCAAFITSNKYLVADYGGRLRQRLYQHAQLHLVLDLTAARPFDALVDPTLTVFSPSLSAQGTVARGKDTIQGTAGVSIAARSLDKDSALDPDDLAPATSTTVLALARDLLPSLPAAVRELLALPLGATIARDDLHAEAAAALPWRHLTAAANGPWPIRCLGHTRHLAERMAEAGQPLGQMVDVRTGIMGFDYRATLACLREDPEAGERRAVTTSMLRTMQCNWGRSSVRLGGARWTAPVLGARPESMSENTWQWFQRPKILIPGISKALRAVFDVDGQYAPLVAVHGAVAEGALGYALAALLCSTPVRWWFSARWEGARIPRGSRRFGVGMLASVPVPADADTLAESLGELGRAWQESGDDAMPADLRTLQADVDAIVWALYGLEPQ